MTVCTVIYNLTFSKPLPSIMAVHASDKLTSNYGLLSCHIACEEFHQGVLNLLADTVW